MANRLPLVNDAGDIKELPAGDMVAASRVSCTPDGVVYTETNVDDALAGIAEHLLDGDNDLILHQVDTTTHGATGAIVGTTNTQTLTNKTLTSPTINSPTFGGSYSFGGTPTFPASLATLTGSQTLTNKTVSATNNTLIDLPDFCNGRLTTESGVPVSTSDRTAQSTLYFTPYNGNRISLYTGTRWQVYTITEHSLALSSLTSGKPYDAFEYVNGGSPALELTAWTSDTARATALAWQDGVLVKSGDATRRYVGTIRTTSASTTEDSETKRYVWNYYNRVPQRLYKTSSGSHTYNTGTIREYNADSTMRVEFVCGVRQGMLCAVEASIQAGAVSTLAQATVGVGFNGTTGFSGSFSAPATQLLEGGVPISFQSSEGYTYLALLQRGTGAATNTFWFARLHGTLLC